MTFTTNSEEVCSVTYSPAYAITAWILFDPLPTAMAEFFQVRGAGLNAILVFQHPDGYVTAVVSPNCNYEILSVNGFNTPAWVHIGISLDPYSQILISAIGWDGVQYKTVQPTSSSFPRINPGLNILISLGGGSGTVADAMMADARFYTNALSAADMVTIANAGNCPSECFGSCTGPVVTECDYLEMSSRNAVITATTQPWSLTYTTITADTAYAFTGWFYFTGTSIGTVTLFRLSYSYNNCCAAGDRVMLLQLNKSTTAGSLILSFDTTTAPNNSISPLSLPVRTSVVRISGTVGVRCSCSSEWNRNSVLRTDFLCFFDLLY